MLLLLHHLLLSSIHLLLLLLSVLLLLLIGLLLLILLLSHLLLLSIGLLLLLVLGLTHLRLATMMRGAGMRLLLRRSTHLLIVSLVLGENFLPHLLSALVDIRIELVAVLFDGELLVVIDWDVDFLSANGLFLRVVELSYVRVLQCLFSCQPLGGVELEKTLQQIESVVGSRREHVSQLFGLGRRQRLEHSLSKGTINRINVLLRWSTSDLHDSVKLIQS